MNDTPPDDHSSTDYLGLDSALLLLGFGLRSLNRQRKLAVICFCSTVALGLVALVLTPKAYRVDMRIQSTTSVIIPSITKSDQPLSAYAQKGTHGVVELIKSRDVLREVCKQTDLMSSWLANRSHLGRLLDRISKMLVGPPDESYLEEALLGTLDKNLDVSLEGDVIVMTLHWPDPAVALNVLEKSQQAFVDKQREQELKEISETIRILEERVAESLPHVEGAIKRVRSLSHVRSPVRSRARRASNANGATLQDVEATQEDLESVRQELAQLQRSYDSRLEKSRERLIELQATLGPKHPDVVSALAEMEDEGKVPEEIVQLQREQTTLAAQLRKMQSEQDSRSRSSQLEEALPTPDQATSEDVKQAVYEYSKLDQAHAEVVARLDKAKMEYDAAKVALDYRYKITMPPVLPRNPAKPKSLPFVLASMVVGGFFALFFSVFADIRSRKLLESWQIERVLRLPVIGEVDVK